MRNEETWESLTDFERTRIGIMLLDTDVAEPLLLYLLNRDEIKGSDLKRDLFYFGEKSLYHYLNVFLRRDIIDEDSWYNTRKLSDKNYKIGKNGRILRNEFIKLNKECEPKTKTLNDEINEKFDIIRILSDVDYYKPVLALRSLDNEMPYKDFLNFGRMKNSYNRLRLKKQNVVDYGYEKDIQTVYLNEEIGKMLETIYGEEILNKFKGQHFGIDIQL